LPTPIIAVLTDFSDWNACAAKADPSRKNLRFRSIDYILKREFYFGSITRLVFVRIKRRRVSGWLADLEFR
jgi:hypothetical protein